MGWPRIQPTNHKEHSLSTQNTGDPTPRQIIVADRGWVFVGHVTREENGDITITDCQNIRIWGTDSDKPGLGWLALHGPTDKTKLDDCGTVRIPLHAQIAAFDVVESSWA